MFGFDRLLNLKILYTSSKQLEFAAKLPNVRYELTPATMSSSEVEKLVAPESSVDLVTVAQALHWFELTTFYSNVKHVLKKPNGRVVLHQSGGQRRRGQDFPAVLR
ncbi:unnamed protein product [Arabidopsis lyrata]|nr:unnamed protein product [Arabidopsis lyrata]